MKLAAAAALAISLAAGSAQAREALSDDEMANARGGVLMAGDLAFQFGATVSTYVNGALALKTDLNWTDNGPVLTRLDDGLLSQLTGTQVIQNLTNGQLTSVVLNTADGRDLRQQTDVTLTLPGFASTQTGWVRALTNLRLSDDLAVGAVRSLGH